ncbi:MAG: baseplate J/gp47 family protein [Eubacterium sp.]|nr:baseplate J/gp47 family protein [Eubacterium sp.]
MSYTREISDILEELLGAIGSEYAKTKGTWLWEIMKAVSIALAEQSEDIEELSNKFRYEDLSGDELDDYVENWSYITRKKAAYASGEVTFTFKSGKTGEIPVGTVVSSGTVNYATEEAGEVTTAGGSVTVAVSALTYGEVGNAEAGEVNILVTSLANVESVVNAYAITGGSDRESDEDLRERYASAIKKAANAGNKAYYEELAETVEGVGDAYCYACPGGVAGTATLYIVNADGGQASESVIEEVQAIVDPNLNGDGSGEAPIGAVVTVKTPEFSEIEVEAALLLETGYSVEDVYEEAYSKIESYFTSAFSDGTVRYNRVGDALLNTAGIVDYKELYLNGGEEDIGTEDEPVIFRLKGLSLT